MDKPLPSKPNESNIGSNIGIGILFVLMISVTCFLLYIIIINLIASFKGTGSGSGSGSGSGKEEKVDPNTVPSFSIIKTLKNKCIGYPGGNPQMDKAQLWDCSGTNDQKWSFDPVTKHIINNDSKKCLGLDDSNNIDVKHLNCNAKQGQQWTWNSTKKTLQNLLNNKCLSAFNDENGYIPTLFDCNSTLPVNLSYS